ncbi:MULTISPECIES: hypothetical protein [Legionella]|uniref:hypothetical protein n=1 Tax=Legionella TaxID=445 RepID=UPI001ED9B0CB|nr:MULTISPECIES: hypothetical protein [Legionella]MDX1837608.1 hypothetical protein [Legionella taurinensis]
MKKGAPNPQNAILSKTGKDAIPHGCVIAIREINEQGLLFFTQRGTRKIPQRMVFYTYRTDKNDPFSFGDLSLILRPL